MRPARRLVTALVLAGGVALLGVAQASTASAHAQIVRSNPADGTNLGVAPRTLTLVMSEAVELRSTKITITDGQGHQTPLAGLREGPPPADLASADPAGGASSSSSVEEEAPVALTAELPALAPDLYRLAWTTLSSDDLHTTSGVIVFGVQREVPARASTPPDPLPGAGEVVLRWTGLIGMGVAVGAFLLWLLMGRAVGMLPEETSLTALPVVRRRLVTAAAIGAVTCAIADAAMLLTQAHAAGSGWLRPAADLLVGSYGARWAGREAAALVVLMLAVQVLTRSGRAVNQSVGRSLVVVAASIGYALSVTLTGHAGASAGRHPFRVVVETVHVTAAITWVGGLVVAAFVLMAPVRTRGAGPGTPRVALAGWRRAVLSRFGIIAASCLAVMVGTGLLLTGAGVASIDAALSSTYGRLLLVKLVFAAVSLSAAAATALAVHPGLVPTWALPIVAGLRLRMVLAIEATAALAVVLAAAALGSAQPAVGSSWTPQSAVQQVVSGTVADLVETVQVSPNRPGRNFVTLDVYDTRRPAPARIGSVLVTLTGPGGRAETAVATAQGSGRWLLPTDALSEPGRWAVDVSVTRQGLAVSQQSYSWVVADPTRGARRTIVSDRPLAPVLTRVAEGFAAVVVLLVLPFLAQAFGRRRRTSAPPSGASPANTSPPKVAATAATNANPSPVPGSPPKGWR
jgi:copper transport protein